MFLHEFWNISIGTLMITIVYMANYYGANEHLFQHDDAKHRIVVDYHQSETQYQYECNNDTCQKLNNLIKNRSQFKISHSYSQADIFCRYNSPISPSFLISPTSLSLSLIFNNNQNIKIIQNIASLSFHEDRSSFC